MTIFVSNMIANKKINQHKNKERRIPYENRARCKIYGPYQKSRVNKGLIKEI